MSDRHVKAVAEAIADALYTNDILGRGGYTREEWMKKYGPKYVPMAQAAIAASDAALVPGLAEAMIRCANWLNSVEQDSECRYTRIGAKDHRKALRTILESLPEEYRK